MSNTIKYQINVRLQDNTITISDSDDKIFVVQSQGTADVDRLVEEMMKVNPGLERETLRMVFELLNRIIMQLLLYGMRINTGLFIIELVCKGVTYDGAWHPDVNSLQINITPTKELREILDNTIINISGEASSAMSVTGGESAQGAGYRVKAGRAFTLHGKNIKVVGDDPSVGITLTNSSSVETKIEGDLIIQNDPSKVVFIVPESTADGEYELKLVTQYSGGGVYLKTPHTFIKTLIVGEAVSDEPDTGDDEEIEDGPQVQ